MCGCEFMFDHARMFANVLVRACVRTCVAASTSACVPTLESTSRRVRQIRLASRAPVLRTIMDSLGSCHVTSTRRHARHVPIYEIDQFDDAHLMCTMRMSIKGKKSNGEKENHSKPQPI